MQRGIKRLALCVLAASLCACHPPNQAGAPTKEGTKDQPKSPKTTTKASVQGDPFVSDVPLVQAQYLSPAFWLRPGMDKVLMSADEITAYNQNSIAIDDTLTDLSTLPDTLDADALEARIRSISNIPKYKRIYADGAPVSEDDFARYEAMLNLEAIKPENAVRFALVVKRTSIRTYPTDDTVFSHDADNRDIDRFQESALFPGDAVAVLHTSTDGAWALVQSYNYIAWAPLESLAIGPRDTVLDYGQGDNFLMITGAKVHAVYNPDVPAVSELQLDMGIRLPLSRPQKLANDLYGQNPYLSHMVILPVRTDDGGLEFAHALINRNKDVHIGYLPYTEANIVKQGFKFLGERYGWGHRYNGRDCTGFVSEVYKTFGLKLPRNSGDQAKSNIGLNMRYGQDDDPDLLLKLRTKRLKSAKVGDLVYIPGHVLMIIGQQDGQPFALHDVTGLGYLKPDGTFYKGTLNQVSLTPVLPLRTSNERSYLEKITTIKALR